MAINVLTEAIREVSPTTVALIGSACLVSTLVAREIWSWYRLSHVPGPFWFSVSQFPLNKLAVGGNLTIELKKLSDKYGPLVRVGPNQVVFSDPDAFRRISGVRSDFVKGPWYDAARIIPDQDNLFSMRDEEKRKELKAKLAPGYSGRDGAAFEPVVDKQIAQLVGLIEQKYLSTPGQLRPFEFAHKALYFALDVVSELAFGEAIGFLANDKDMYNYVEINDGFFPILVVLFTTPWLDSVLKTWPLSLALPKEGDQVGFGRLMGFSRSVVDKHLETGAVPANDMMQSHIRNGLSRRELLADSHLALIAGSDSTATAIRMTLLSLLSAPAAFVALRAEIDAGIAAGHISSPIRNAEARQLPYLQAIIKESIRMYPPQTGLNNKRVPKGGAKVLGYHLPEGTDIGNNIQKMMRSKEIFGEDADCFRPERWLEAAKDEDRFKEMGAVVELDFGYGKYMCLGKTIAFMELNKVIVELLRRFDFAVMNTASPIKLFDAGFWVANDFWLRVTPRADVK